MAPIKDLVSLDLGMVSIDMISDFFHFQAFHVRLNIKCTMITAQIVFRSNSTKLIYLRKLKGVLFSISLWFS